MPAVFAETLEQTLSAEKFGYESVLVCEHHLLPDAGYFPQPLIAVAGLASATKKIRVGTGIMLLPLYHPLHVAEMAATIDIISAGRLELGIGAGWNEEESGAYGIELGSRRERSDRFEEACQVLIGLLSQQTTDFDGRYYQLAGARCEPKGSWSADATGRWCSTR